CTEPFCPCSRTDLHAVTPPQLSGRPCAIHDWLNPIHRPIRSAHTCMSNQGAGCVAAVRMHLPVMTHPFFLRPHPPAPELYRSHHGGHRSTLPRRSPSFV